MWYTPNQHPCPLPEVIYTPEGLTVSNLKIYSEEQLNAWGWFKCPNIREYNYFYYAHTWQEPNWVYEVTPYSLRLEKINAKKLQYAQLLRTWYREARYESLITDTPNPALEQYLQELQGEINRIMNLVYEDAFIDDALADIDNFEVTEEIDLDLNPQTLDFWYNYNNNSMPVKQRGGFGLI